jgi:hypothetical protein
MSHRRRALTSGSLLAAGAAVLALAGALLGPVSAATADDGESLFLHAKEAWRSRTEAPFVSYGVRTRYEDGGRIMDTWYQVSYRASDGALAVDRIHLPGDEARLRGAAFSIFGVTLFDTNPDAQVATALREPAIEPAFTFGLMPRAYRSPVVPVPGDPTPAPVPGELREIGRVIAINREYRVTLVGLDHLRYGEAYHLALVPVREPRENRLRDIWIATGTFVMLQERVAGILDTKPYDAATWTITYVPLAGRMYLQQIRADDALRFGERHVVNFQLDFVDYRFPSRLPDYAFDHWL